MEPLDALKIVSKSLALRDSQLTRIGSRPTNSARPYSIKSSQRLAMKHGILRALVPAKTHWCLLKSFIDDFESPENAPETMNNMCLHDF